MGITHFVGKLLPMDLDLAQKAVTHALAGHWKEAVKLNNEILKKDPKDVDCLNRLAKAYAETGNIKKAKSITEKVLKIDSFNSIAAKALKKWRGGQNDDASGGDVGRNIFGRARENQNGLPPLLGRPITHLQIGRRR